MPTGQRHALPTVTKVESSKYTTGSHYVVSKFFQSCPKLVPKSLLILNTRNVFSTIFQHNFANRVNNFWVYLFFRLARAISIKFPTADWFSQKQDWATKLIKKYYSPLCLSCLIKWEASKVMSILGIGSLPLILLQGKCKKGATTFWDMIFIKIHKRLTWLGS